MLVQSFSPEADEGKATVSSLVKFTPGCEYHFAAQAALSCSPSVRYQHTPEPTHTTPPLQSRRRQDFRKTLTEFGKKILCILFALEILGHLFMHFSHGFL
jgi:hypothetical protein